MGSDKVTLNQDYGMGDLAAGIFGRVTYHIWHVICVGLDKQVKYVKGEWNMYIIHLKRNFDTTKILRKSYILPQRDEKQDFFFIV